jgi:hypothetical protein
MQISSCRKLVIVFMLPPSLWAGVRQLWSKAQFLEKTARRGAPFFPGSGTLLKPDFELRCGQ